MKILKEYIWITIGTIIVGSSVYLFLVPSHLAIASVSAIALMLNAITNIPISVFTMILNIICLLLALFFVGQEFTGKTVYSSILLPVVIGVYEKILPNYESITGSVLADMICHVVVVGFGISLLFFHNASSGGIDIIAKILNKYFHVDLGNAMSVAGICVCLSSFFVYDASVVVFSLLGTYLQGQMVDHFSIGLGARRKVCIVADEYEAILDYILNEVDSGATLYQVQGGHTGKCRSEIVTILNKEKYVKLMRYFDDNSIDCYITVYSVKEIREKNFNKKRILLDKERKYCYTKSEPVHIRGMLSFCI